MKNLERIDYLLQGLLASMITNEQEDTAFNDAWKNGFQACDKIRIKQVKKIRQEIVFIQLNKQKSKKV